MDVMDGDPDIVRLHVLPDYSRGFLFSWEVGPGFESGPPWEFLVQAGESETGPWRDLSPVLEGASMWRADGSARVGKSRALSFRVLLRTPDGVSASHPVSPYGDLGRKDFLIGRDVMRRELLHLREMAGVEVLLFRRSSWGPRCGCVDPVTGQVRDSHCRRCLGTGKSPPYMAPVRAWASFSEDSRHLVEHSQGGLGMAEQKSFEARLLSSAPLDKNDVVHDVASGKRYYVDRVSVAAEIRRVPLVQNVVLNEIAVTDAAYMATGGTAPWCSTSI